MDSAAHIAIRDHVFHARTELANVAVELRMVATIFRFAVMAIVSMSTASIGDPPFTGIAVEPRALIARMVTSITLIAIISGTLQHFALIAVGLVAIGTHTRA